MGGREQTANWRRKQCRDVGAVARTVAGAAFATEVTSVAGTVTGTSRLTPRPRGEPRAYQRCVVRCLSRVRCQDARTVLRGREVSDGLPLPDRRRALRWRRRIG